MVIANVGDSIIHNKDELIINIIKEYNIKKSVEINLNNEGPALLHCGMYDLLDKITKEFEIPKKSITIYTNNVEELHDDYNIIILNSTWVAKAKKHASNYELINKNIIKSVGMFVHRSSWHRLTLLAWLQKSNNALITCHHNPKDEIYRAILPLTELYFEDPTSLTDVVEFIKQCPILLKDNLFNGTPSEEYLYNLDSEIYNKIFLELVAETFITGAVFCPNEKTFRPILAETPFIVMGPCKFLSNLQRIGFKTFNRYWDESYDDLSGLERITAIKNLLITEIFNKNLNELTEMYNDMKDILIHNKELLMSISGSNIKK